MIPIGNMIATLDGFKPLKEVLDGYYKAIELEKENAKLLEALEKITDLHADDGIYMLGIAYEALKQGKEE